jgi:hypothetical protein
LSLKMKIQIWNSPKCFLTPRILIWKTRDSKLLHDAAIFKKVTFRKHSFLLYSTISVFFAALKNCT